jgi:hypothetical protein
LCFSGNGVRGQEQEQFDRGCFSNKNFNFLLIFSFEDPDLEIQSGISSLIKIAKSTGIWPFMYIYIFFKQQFLLVFCL